MFQTLIYALYLCVIIVGFLVLIRYRLKYLNCRSRKNILAWGLYNDSEND